jgi:hypothetical protein
MKWRETESLEEKQGSRMFGTNSGVLKQINEIEK